MGLFGFAKRPSHRKTLTAYLGGRARVYSKRGTLFLTGTLTAYQDDLWLVVADSGGSILVVLAEVKELRLGDDYLDIILETSDNENY